MVLRQSFHNSLWCLQDVPETHLYPWCKFQTTILPILCTSAMNTMSLVTFLFITSTPPPFGDSLLESSRILSIWKHHHDTPLVVHPHLEIQCGERLNSICKMNLFDTP